MKYINKHSFLEYDICPVRGWIAFNNPQRTEPSIAEEFRMKQGIDIGKRTHSLFPNGVLIKDLEPFEASMNTSLLLNDPTINTVFEAAFVDDNYVAKADIVKKKGKGLAVYEVKSSLSTTSKIKDYIKDLTHTVMVIEDSGHKVVDASLILISKDYRKGDDNTKLFEIVDVFDEMCTLKVDLHSKKSQAALVLNSFQPQEELGYKCRDCEYLYPCFGFTRDYSIFELPRFGAKNTEAFLEDNLFYLCDIPVEAFLDKPQFMRMYDAVMRGEAVVNDRNTLQKKLDILQYPVGYLDFETAATVIPLYDYIAPYEPVPYQYSLHILGEPNGVIEHRDFLFSDPSSDETWGLALKLLEDTKNCKTIMAHHMSTEKGLILWLADRFKDNKDISEKLVSLTDMLVDSEPLIRNHIYHPEFHGSFSIKKVLPALVKGLDYKGRLIENGDDASFVFANMALGNYSKEEAKNMREEMIEYCKLDTLALVEIHKKLIQFLWQ